MHPTYGRGQVPVTKWFRWLRRRTKRDRRGVPLTAGVNHGGPISQFSDNQVFSGWVGWGGAGGERFFPGNSLGSERSPVGLQWW